MIKTFTQDDLIRFLYRETTEEENLELTRALKQDAELALQFNELQSLIQKLDDTLVEPSKKVIDSILNYSKSH
jgi:hypothetical protein